MRLAARFFQWIQDPFHTQRNFKVYDDRSVGTTRVGFDAGHARFEAAQVIAPAKFRVHFVARNRVAQGFQKSGLDRRAFAEWHRADRQLPRFFENQVARDLPALKAQFDGMIAGKQRHGLIIPGTPASRQSLF